MKQKTKEKGISLIVLVITIIIIIILAGAVVLSLNNSGIISKAKESIFKKDIAEIKDSMNIYSVSNITSGGELGYPNEAEILNTNKYSGRFKILGGELFYIGSDIKEKEWAIASGVKDATSTMANWTQNVNVPQIPQSTGNTIKGKELSGSSWIDATSTWYNYDTSNKKWANMQTADGSMWVWIPRFAYKITSGYHGAGLSENQAGTIDVKFLIGNTDVAYDGTRCKRLFDSKNNYVVHPAFTFGTEELPGIWVAKFEATAREGVANTYAGDNVTTKHVKSAPAVQSWRYTDIGTIFTACRNMETDTAYGWDGTGNKIDTHLIKNLEWGAVGYLAYSKYGRNGTSINLNTSLSYYTGGTSSASSVYSSNILQTTTGNAYGVYDMAGGYEYTAAYYAASDKINMPYTQSIYTADAKYKDTYNKEYFYVVNKFDGYYYQVCEFGGYEYYEYDEAGNPLSSGIVQTLEEVPQACKDGTYGSWYYTQTNYTNSGTVQTLEEIPQVCKDGTYGSYYEALITTESTGRVSSLNEVPQICKDGTYGSSYSQYAAYGVGNYGDGIYETSKDTGIIGGWHNDDMLVPTSNYPFFFRGGTRDNWTNNGIFTSGSVSGGSGLTGKGDAYYAKDTSFRPILAVSM